MGCMISIEFECIYLIRNLDHDYTILLHEAPTTPVILRHNLGISCGDALLVAYTQPSGSKHVYYISALLEFVSQGQVDVKKLFFVSHVIFHLKLYMYVSIAQEHIE